MLCDVVNPCIHDLSRGAFAIKNEYFLVHDVSLQKLVLSITYLHARGNILASDPFFDFGISDSTFFVKHQVSVTRYMYVLYGNEQELQH